MTNTARRCHNGIASAGGIATSERPDRHAQSLWRITGHCSVAQIDELVTALDLIADEHGRGNKTSPTFTLQAVKAASSGEWAQLTGRTAGFSRFPIMRIDAAAHPATTSQPSPEPTTACEAGRPGPG